MEHEDHARSIKSGWILLVCYFKQYKKQDSKRSSFIKAQEKGHRINVPGIILDMKGPGEKDPNKVCIENSVSHD